MKRIASVTVIMQAQYKEYQIAIGLFAQGKFKIAQRLFSGLQRSALSEQGRQICMFNKALCTDRAGNAEAAFDIFCELVRVCSSIWLWSLVCNQMLGLLANNELQLGDKARQAIKSVLQSPMHRQPLPSNVLFEYLFGNRARSVPQFKMLFRLNKNSANLLNFVLACLLQERHEELGPILQIARALTPATQAQRKILSLLFARFSRLASASQGRSLRPEQASISPPSKPLKHQLSTIQLKKLPKVKKMIRRHVGQLKPDSKGKRPLLRLSKESMTMLQVKREQERRSSLIRNLLKEQTLKVRNQSCLNPVLEPIEPSRLRKVRPRISILPVKNSLLPKQTQFQQPVIPSNSDINQNHGVVEDQNQLKSKPQYYQSQVSIVIEDLSGQKVKYSRNEHRIPSSNSHMYYFEKNQQLSKVQQLADEPQLKRLEVLHQIYKNKEYDRVIACIESDNIGNSRQAIILKGKCYRRKGDLDSTKKQMRRILAGGQDYDRLGWWLVKGGLLGEGLQFIEKAITLDQGKKEYAQHFAKGALLLKNTQVLKSALKYYRTFINGQQRSAQSHLYLKLLEQLGYHQEFLAYCKANASSQDKINKGLLAKALFLNGRVAEAISQAKKDCLQGGYQQLYSLAGLLSSVGETTKSMKIYENLISRYPSNSKAYLAAVELLEHHQEADSTPKRIRLYAQLYKLQPDNVLIFLKLVNLLISSGQLQQAQAYIKEAHKFGLEVVLRVRAQLYFKQERYEDSLKMYTQLKKHTRKLENTVQAKVILCLYRLQRYSQVDQLIEFLPLQGFKQDVLVQLSQAYIQSQDYLKGMNVIRGYGKKLACNSRLLFNLGLCQSMAGELVPAQQHFKAALKLDPGLAQAYYNLALGKLKRGNAVEALEYARQAVLLRPKREWQQNLREIEQLVQKKRRLQQI